MRSFSAKASTTLPAVNIEKLDIPLGGIIAVIGSSGSGKTTFLNLISGLETPDVPAGCRPVMDLRLPGETHVYRLSQHSSDRHAFPHERVSYVFQQGYLLNHASLFLNLAITRRAAGLEADRDSLNSLLSVTQLNDEQDGSVKALSDRAISLSGGQQQRVNIARALGREPALLFADELTSSLDPDKARAVLSQLSRWVWGNSCSSSDSRTRLKRCMIWVTHDYNLAAEFADAIIVMKNGKLAEGSQLPVECQRLPVSPDAANMLEWVRTGIVSNEFVTQPASQSDDSTIAHEETGKSSTELSTDTSQTVQYKASSHRVDQPSGNSISRSQAAIGNFFSGIQLSLMDSYRSQYPSRSSVANIAKAAMRPVSGYHNWVRSLQLAAVLGLIMLVTYGQNEVVAYFDQQLADPSLRHVIVNQNMSSPDQSIVNEESLQDLETVISQRSSLPPNQQEDSIPRSAFGRFTEYRSAYPEGLDEIADGFVAEIAVGILDPEEPVYSMLEVFAIDEENPGCENNEVRSPGELIPYDDELVIILSERYLDTASRMFDADLCTAPYLDLWDKSLKTFRIAGFVEHPPADGYDNFDALMQIDVWRTWYSGMNKRQINNLSRAAVYFDQRNHEQVIDELFNRSFAFDQEIVSKFKRLMSTSSQLRNTFVVLTWLALLVAVTIATGLVWSYLMNNAKSIAILRAHKAWFWPLLSAIPFQLFLAFAYALVYLALAGALWNVLVEQSAFVEMMSAISGGDWIPAKLSLQQVQSTVPWLLASFVAMLVTGWLCLLLWRLTHRKLAYELSQAH